jgi:acyl dehydratase
MTQEQDSVITQEMRDAIGVESEPVSHEIEKGAIIKFAQAIGDTNPLFNDDKVARASRHGGIIAPPTYLRNISSGPMAVEIKSPFSANLDGGSEWEYFESVRPGDIITVTRYFADMYERTSRAFGKTLFMIQETKYVNQFGQTVALQRTTGISYNPPA